jgi:hypothetical protein
MPRHAPVRALSPATSRDAALLGGAPHDRPWTLAAVAALLLTGALLVSHGVAYGAPDPISECPPAVSVRAVDSAIAAGDERSAYAYPYRDPYLATITAAALNPDGLTPGLKRQVVHVPVLPERNNLPTLEGRGEVSVALYRQHRPAPLLFILSGIGSNPYFGLGTYFANVFHREGFHVVVLPSPMHWNFALAASPSGAPGYAPDDARDLYDVMQRTLLLIKGRYGVQVTGTHFMGASLGALEGAYLSVIDGEQRKIGIERFLLVNPPLDLPYAVERLDEWAALQEKFGPERSDALRGRALAIVESFTRDKRDDLESINRLARKFACFTTEELQYLIAGYVQTTIPELVYVTQAIHDQQLLVSAKGRVSERLEEAKGFTLTDYTNKIAMPMWTRRVGLQANSQSLRNGGSLAAILDRVRSNPRVFIVHNADDVLTERGLVEELKSAMGDRMILYPAGGHLGNLWFQQNKDAIIALFKNAATSESTR